MGHFSLLPLQLVYLLKYPLNVQWCRQLAASTAAEGYLEAQMYPEAPLFVFTCSVMDDVC